MCGRRCALYSCIKAGDFEGSLLMSSPSLEYYVGRFMILKGIRLVDCSWLLKL